MPRLAPLALAAAGILLLPAAAAEAPPTTPLDRVPEDLSGQATRLQGHLGNASEAEDLDEARAAVEAADPLADDVIPLLQDLQGDDRSGDLLAELWTSLEAASEEGNLSDVRSLSASAADTLDDDLVPRAEAWERNRTAVTVGQAEAGEGDRFRVPIVAMNPPPAGLGALDAGIALDPDEARPREASVELGRGEATVDPANGTARAASFKAEALAGLDAGSGPAAVFASVSVEPAAAAAGDRLAVEVTVHDAADARGNPIPVIAPDGDVVVPEGSADGIPTRWGGLAAVGLLGAGALVALRRLEV